MEAQPKLVPEAEIAIRQWLRDERAKNPSARKVPVTVLMAEGRRRGYCICPKPMRHMISFRGMTCAWCMQPETDDSWRFWYEEKYAL